MTHTYTEPIWPPSPPWVDTFSMSTWIYMHTHMLHSPPSTHSCHVSTYWKLWAWCVLLSCCASICWSKLCPQLPYYFTFASLATLDDNTELLHWLKVHIHTLFLLTCFSSLHPRMVKCDALPAQSFHPSTISKIPRTTMTMQVFSYSWIYSYCFQLSL